MAIRREGRGAVVVVIAATAAVVRLISLPAVANADVSGFHLNPYTTTNNCMSTTGFNSPVGMRPCDFTEQNPLQNWHLGPWNATVGGYRIINSNGQCLGIAGANKSPGAAVFTWQCLDPTHTEQFWNFVTPNLPACRTPYTQLVNVNSKLVVGLTGGTDTTSASVVQWTNVHQCNNQYWTSPFYYYPWAE